MPTMKDRLMVSITTGMVVTTANIWEVRYIFILSTIYICIRYLSHKIYDSSYVIDIWIFKDIVNNELINLHNENDNVGELNVDNAEFDNQALLVPNERQFDNIEEHLRHLDPDYDQVMNGVDMANHGANFNVDGESRRYNI